MSTPEVEVRGRGSRSRQKFIAVFDFEANPNVNPAIIFALATGERVRKGQPLCLIGDSGTGKSHLLIGLGSAALEKGPSPGGPAATCSLATPAPGTPSAPRDAGPRPRCTPTRSLAGTVPQFHADVTVVTMGSAPRLALWRKLKRLGVAQLADGLVALPADARTREQLEWAADEAIRAGGSAGVWLARPTTRAQERELARSMNEARAAEYDALIDQATGALTATGVERARILRRLRAENNRIRRRDFFRPAQREQARQALAVLASTLVGSDSADQNWKDVVR